MTEPDSATLESDGLYGAHVLEVQSAAGRQPSHQYEVHDGHHSLNDDGRPHPLHYTHHQRVFKGRTFEEKDWHQHTSFRRFLPEGNIMCAHRPPKRIDVACIMPLRFWYDCAEAQRKSVC